MTTSSFVPRPIYHVKPYGVVVEEGDTLSGIAQKFGRPAGDYRELVAANLQGRTLMPTALGSPYSSRTFARLDAGEVLRIPARWPDPPGVSGVAGTEAPGVLGDPQLDDIATGIFAAAQAVNAGSGNVYDKTAMAAVTNAALQWYYATQGTTPAADPSKYYPYVGAAMAWWNQYGEKIVQQTGNPAVATSFPWAAFLSMLPATPNLLSVDWAAGAVPGTAGVLWSNIPWAYLGGLGSSLESIKVPPIDWPYVKDAPAVLQAFKTAIGQGAASGSEIKPGQSCGQNSHVASDLQCYCDPGYKWSAVAGTDCIKDDAVKPPPTSQADCTEPGEVFDARGPSGAHCYVCDAPFVYNPNSAQCECPAGQQWNGTSCVATSSVPAAPTPAAKACPKGTTWDATAEVCVQESKPSALVEKPADDTTKRTMVIAAVGVASVLALGVGAIYLATRTPAKAGKEEAST